jgi:hypothetical protein
MIKIHEYYFVVQDGGAIWPIGSKSLCDLELGSLGIWIW